LHLKGSAARVLTAVTQLTGCGLYSHNSFFFISQKQPPFKTLDCVGPLELVFRFLMILLIKT